MTGEFSWQKWRYEIEYSRNDSMVILNETSPTFESHLIFNHKLKLHDITRIVKYRIRAISPGGKGIWTNIFKGHLLPYTSSYRGIVQ